MENQGEETPHRSSVSAFCLFRQSDTLHMQRLPLPENIPPSIEDFYLPLFCGKKRNKPVCGDIEELLELSPGDAFLRQL
eukprot:scaffold6124_cov122-Cylindrotheca_fusiformis.AAC.15